MSADPPPSPVPDDRPLAELPAVGFWETLYGRRSIRRFEQDAVPRELIDQVLHAGIWAPSSCNYQMWDVVAVTDPELGRALGALSAQLANAPVNLIVAYGRDFSTEGWANIQSASAMIQNMSLAAHALGLGTFWITQLGDAESVRELVGLPRDRVVIAALALGWPKARPRAAPPRRPLAQVTHYNRYTGRAIPSSIDPADWTPELLATYQRARVLNGLRHNKPRAWEVRALERFVEELAPSGEGRWLDVLPCTGIVTERLARLRPGFAFDVVERTREVAEFVAKRTRPEAGVRGWPETSESLPPPQERGYDVITCLFRLEGLAPDDRPELVARLARWLRPGGRLLLGYVSRRSFHGATERLRRRRGGPGGVEYALAPDPSIGPFEALLPAEVEEWIARAGLTVAGRLGLQAIPPREELEFRTRNFSRWTAALVRGLGRGLAPLERLPGVEGRWGRFRFLAARGE